jgi:hypothetical protein
LPDIIDGDRTGSPNREFPKQGPDFNPVDGDVLATVLCESHDRRKVSQLGIGRAGWIMCHSLAKRG